METNVFKSQLEDTDALNGLLNAAESIAGGMAFEGPAMSSMGIEEATSRLQTGRTDLDNPNTTEAIVMLHGYPSLLVQNGEYSRPENPVWRHRLDPHRDKLMRVIANTGRVDLLNHPHYKWVGTAWRINANTFITNQHVANIFAQAKNGRFSIQPGIKVHIDLAEEHASAAQLEYLIGSIHHIENVSMGGVDMAVLTLDPMAASMAGDPIELAPALTDSEFIGVVGYPAYDRRNPQDPMDQIFNGIYNVKRLAPGKIMQWSYSENVFTHNCTTLGGNSGSVVFDIESGCAIGLHFAGNALRQNYAVKAKAIQEVLRRTGVYVGSSVHTTQSDELSEAANLIDRRGYDPHFIGTDHLTVPMPQLNCAQQKHLAKTKDGNDTLRYQHFSVVMNGTRKLAFVAAANIDGDDLRRPKRVNSFRLDPRLETEQQAGELLYARNDLDRGHLIRRLDPCWGSQDVAKVANRDSFFFPNIGPQHKNLNQKIWLDIENHILEVTDARDARVSVFVGCVFGDSDPVHEPSGIAIPLGFWKVVASVGRVQRGRAERRELQAQAFVLWQDHLLQPGDLEIIFGQNFSTHQITIEELERLSGLSFGPLTAADTFGLPPEMREQQQRESVVDVAYSDRERSTLPLSSLNDIILGNKATEENR